MVTLGLYLSRFPTTSQGGPFKHVETIGVGAASKILDKFYAQFGDRFKKAAYFHTEKVHDEVADPDSG